MSFAPSEFANVATHSDFSRELKFQNGPSAKSIEVKTIVSLEISLPS